MNLRRLLPTLTFALGMTAVAAAQQPAARITAAIDNGTRATLAGSKPARANAANDLGAVAPGTKLEGMSLVFGFSDAQQNELDTLLAAQQNPNSPLYHAWLTPEQFAARFGAADADIAKVESWLESQGFAVTGVSRSKTRVTFSGTAAQVEAAFSAPLHNFRGADGQAHYAPANDLTVPAALGSVVRTVGNLTSFKPHAQVKLHAPVAAASGNGANGVASAKFTSGGNFTSNQSGSHFLTPKDVATIYDVNAAYSAGYTGSGQTIGVIGQSAVVASDIVAFQAAAGVAGKTPTLTLMPGTGTSTIYSGDEAESDLDLEYTSTVAPGASVTFVYTGNNTNYGAFDALEYLIDNKVTTIISSSYGDCETDLGQANYTALNQALAQAATQGQTVVAASGDNGSTDCYEDTNQTSTVRAALAVDFPADSQYVTGLGGTEVTSANNTSSTYWTTASGSDVISSAKSYIPEIVWNDDSSGSLSSSGGGVSLFTARPSWQTGVTGIPSGSYRLVPDVSLLASPDSPGYLYCSSDTNATGISGSCANGFRDSNSTYLTVAGGTSFAAPIFSGMLALVAQAHGATGLGAVNTKLYSLASTPTVYASAFHDVTSGTNGCTGLSLCTTTNAGSFAATTGYDEATGLGSVDLYNLLQSWSTATTAAPNLTITAATTIPNAGASDVVTVTVGAGSTGLTATPTGTIVFAVDGTNVGTVTLAAGVATYTFSSTVSGTHTITATYSGDTVYSSASGTLTVNVGGTTAAKSFALTGGALTLTDGNSGAVAITVTPQNNYTGTVLWTVTPSQQIANACYTLPSTSVASTTAVTATLSVFTNSSLCTSSGVTALGVISQGQAKSSGGLQAANRPAGWNGHGLPVLALAGLLGFGVAFRRRRELRPLLAVAGLAVIGLGVSGCGDGGNYVAPTSSLATKGTYTLTVKGTDSATGTITATTTVTLTIQ